MLDFFHEEKLMLLIKSVGYFGLLGLLGDASLINLVFAKIYYLLDIYYKIQLCQGLRDYYYLKATIT